MKKLFLLLCLPLLLCACSAFTSALTDKDVAQYIKAYDNIAAISPELTKLQSDNKSIALMTCGPCRARLEQAVQEAGYVDLKAFMAMDIRMHLTLRAWVYVTITKMGGEVGQGVAASDFCKLKENIARSANPEEMKRHCDRLQSYSSYLDKAGAIAVAVAEKLLKEGDIDVVAKHESAIFKAFVNPKLHDDYNHAKGGSYDD